MKLISKAAVLVGMMAVVGASAGAQSQAVAGNTTGCFYPLLGCTASHSSNNGGGVTFTGLSGFNWTAVAGSPQNVTLGTMNWNSFSAGLSFFDLTTTVTSPPSSPSQQTAYASVAGAFVFGHGGFSLDFDNTAHEFDFANGSLFLTVDDINGGHAGSNNITGTVTYVPTTTPEPSSMALIGTGLFGLVPMVRRRKK